MSGRVIVVGSINVDLVVRSDRLPGPGETVTGGSFERHHGGKGGNQAVAAARLGASVHFIGAIGADSFGSEARAALAAEGIDVTGVATIPHAATGIALILVDATAENLISIASGANRLLGSVAVERELTRLGPLPGDVVLISNELAPESVGAALRAARVAGARTILNPAPASAIDRTLLKLVDLLTPNRGELLVLVGGASADVDEASAARILPIREAVIVTLGAAGALVVPRDGAARSVRAIAVEAIDTTGAGDAFNGALAAALAKGLDLAESVRRATAAGSLATTHPGARDGMPTTAELELALRG
jgi:ribokinase